MYTARLRQIMCFATPTLKLKGGRYRESLKVGTNKNQLDCIRPEILAERGGRTDPTPKRQYPS